MLKTLYTSLSITLLACLPVLAIASTVTVEAFQAPAWKENAAGIFALKPGMTLQADDRIKTGQKAKVLLRLSEGSHVKLGEKSLFLLSDLSEETIPETEDKNIFKAAMQVLNGAFRFTTSRLGKANRRNVDIKLVTATIGIRGTDLWGRANDDEDFICLIEGNIDIDRENEATVNMQTPLSLYTAKHTQAAAPVGSVASEAVAKLALETELDKGQGIISESGEYTVYLLSSIRRDRAEKAQQQFNQLGYATEIIEADVENTRWHRVAITSFASLNDARYFANNIKGILNIKQPWVAPN